MKSSITIQKVMPPLLIIFALGCFGLLPKAQALNPAPDGGYAGGNTAEGTNALFSLTTGGYNTGNGWNSLHTLSSGSFNTGIGAATLFANTGDSNTAVGAAALFSNTTGAFNTANGAFALFMNTTGYDNTANGADALLMNTTGIENTAVGRAALENNTGGGYNTAIGEQALYSNTTGSFNIALGRSAGFNVTTATNVICIGAVGNNVDNSCYIGNIFNATSSGGTAVYVNSNGRLGTATSSRRFKEEIKPMDKASEVLLGLKPVTFRYKKGIDPEGIPQFGLVAEEVAKVNPDLVVRDKEGKPYSVRYEAVNAMLLNEFLKEHKKVEEQQTTIGQLKSNAAKQEATISELKSDLQTVVARLKDQDSKIQSVSAELEIMKRLPQVVATNP